MELRNEFEVTAPLDRVWAYMLDVEAVAACMPGGEITEAVDDRTWNGKTSVKVGPVNLSFSGTVTMVEREDAVHRVVLRAEGKEQRGKGAATADVTSHLRANGDATHVEIVADLMITGAVAQFGRGMLQDVSARLTKEFATCISDSIAARSSVAEAGQPIGAVDTPSTSTVARDPVRQPAQVKGIRLALWALWRAIVRSVKRLFGRSDATR